MSIISVIFTPKIKPTILTIKKRYHELLEIFRIMREHSSGYECL